MKPPLFFLFLFLSNVTLAQSTGAKTRLIVLTDIENEPDDSQSLVRLLTYANQIQIEGLIATTSIHLQKRVAPETIHRIIRAYGKVQPNLLKHEPGYPTAQALKTLIKKGLPVYGMGGVGPGNDSEGSTWIIRQLEKPDNRPIWVSVWGGVNTLAQALWTIQKTRTPEQAERLYRKLRVYTISDQDDSGPWIRKTFPGVFYVVSPGYGYEYATWLGMNTGEPGTQPEYVSNAWLAEHIQQGHGPLGALYPDVAFGMEGDTPSFLGLIPNGLNVPEHPDWGGWGGRYVLQTPTLVVSRNKPANAPAETAETRPVWTNSADSVLMPRSFMPQPMTKEPRAGKSTRATIWRWRPEFQNDFAARMDWCTKSYKAANHPPVPRLSHPENLTIKSGEQFYLRASESTDPDGDSMSFRWMQYPEAGTYPGIISYENFVSNIYEARPIAPTVTSPQTIHFILKVTDKGTPALTRYKRVIVTVVP
ncbi:nucleoside hydrolase-like domain-containing protein [Spirosoma rigui]|uniref:nucleoside hydrolase-like domain-containing protein n=1 Tax=Spirosoma rigui TaxID=564064 RepID=UPI0009B0BBE4|nr:nucleoside hydrolase-like domain-containing protein [Spirosoma rigui]